MSYQTERSAIETYLAANLTSLTLGFDGQSFTPTNGSVLLTIKSGAVLQGSIGRMANRIDYLGLVMFQIFTEGGKGSQAWRGIAETISNLLFEKTLTTVGTLIESSSESFIRFSPPQLGDNRHPYIAADFDAVPFHQANINAPYIRYEYK